VLPGQETPFDAFLDRGEDRWQFNIRSEEVQFGLELREGAVETTAGWSGERTTDWTVDIRSESDEGIECTLEEFQSAWIPESIGSYAESRADAEASLESWLDRLPAGPAEYADAHRRAGYITWSSVVDPREDFQRPAMLMSKNWMSKVWAWDHCFNAMALAEGHPELAWDQLLIPFDHQREHGGLPDSMSNNGMQYAIVKTPIHGWALNWMLDRGLELSRSQRFEAYDCLRDWTTWWLNYRDDDGDGVPQYNHGCETADNASVFAEGVPVESPDLSACLVLQMDLLERLATDLGMGVEAEQWARRSEDLFDRLFEHSWNGEQFVAPRSGTHETVEGSDSLLVYRPLLLGDRLPESALDALVDGLEDRFLTEYGLASENPESPFYETDGYWRGAIWAPTTMMIVDGLERAGRSALASEIAERFCDMAAAEGMAENYDALTGEGLRDRAYTWTASVFLVLGNEYLD
jgi:glycogen debranching enzyme